MGENGEEICQNGKTGQRRDFVMQARDWLTAIENEYVTGRESLQKLGEKYDVPLRAMLPELCGGKIQTMAELKDVMTG